MKKLMLIALLGATVGNAIGAAQYNSDFVVENNTGENIILSTYGPTPPGGELNNYFVPAGKTISIPNQFAYGAPVIIPTSAVLHLKPVDEKLSNSISQATERPYVTKLRLEGPLGSGQAFVDFNFYKPNQLESGQISNSNVPFRYVR